MMKGRIRALTLAGLVGAAPVVFADSSDSGSSSSSSSYGSSSSSSYASNYEKGREAALAGRYDTAIHLLNRVVKKDNRHADAYNMLGYSYRKKGNYQRSFRYYNKALAIEPDHKGAHEYIGQAYVEQNNLGEARKHLARLDKICWSGCQQYDTLKAAIEAKASGKPQASGGYQSDDRG